MRRHWRGGQAPARRGGGGWVHGTLRSGAVLASVHELQWDILNGRLFGLTHSDQARIHRAQGKFLTRWWSGRRWRWRASCIGRLKQGGGLCWTWMGRRTRKTAEGILWDRRVIKRCSTLCRAPWRQGAVVVTKGWRRQRHGGVAQSVAQRTETVKRQGFL